MQKAFYEAGQNHKINNFSKRKDLLAVPGVGVNLVKKLKSKVGFKSLYFKT